MLAGSRYFVNDLRTRFDKGTVETRGHNRRD